MGNEQANYAGTYNTWVQYRNKIKSLAPSNLPVAGKNQVSSNGKVMTVSEKKSVNTSEIPVRSNVQVSTVREEYLKNSTASVVGASHGHG